MSDEQKIEEKECKCICQSKWFKKFLVVSVGSFVGVFCALSLFAALHRPPVAPCPFRGPYMRPPMAYQMHHFNRRGIPGDFHQKMVKERFNQKAQFEKGQVK